MTPRAWRESKGLTQAELADQLGLADASIVHRYEQGLRDPGTAVKEKYFLLSEGAVEPNDFYPLVNWRGRLSAALAAARAALLGEAA